MTYYHISPDGNPRECSNPENCRYKTPVSQHYSNKEDAKAAYEKIMSKKSAWFGLKNSDTQLIEQYYDDNNLQEKGIEKEEFIKDTLSDNKKMKALRWGIKIDVEEKSPSNNVPKKKKKVLQSELYKLSKSKDHDDLMLVANEGKDKALSLLAVNRKAPSDVLRVAYNKTDNERIKNDIEINPNFYYEKDDFKTNEDIDRAIKNNQRGAVRILLDNKFNDSQAEYFISKASVYVPMEDVLESKISDKNKEKFIKKNELKIYSPEFFDKHPEYFEKYSHLISQNNIDIIANTKSKKVAQIVYGKISKDLTKDYAISSAKKLMEHGLLDESQKKELAEKSPSLKKFAHFLNLKKKGAFENVFELKSSTYTQRVYNVDLSSFPEDEKSHFAEYANNILGLGLGGRWIESKNQYVVYTD